MFVNNYLIQTYRMSQSEYESDDQEQDIQLYQNVEPPRKKFSPRKDTTAKKQQALKNLEKARLTRKINADNKKKAETASTKYVVDYSDSESESDEEIIIPKSKKIKIMKGGGSELDDEFKRQVLEQLQELKRKQKKKPDRQTIINIPTNGSAPAQDMGKKRLLDMFNN
jgi:hypothetical protein